MPPSKNYRLRKAAISRKLIINATRTGKTDAVVTITVSEQGTNMFQLLKNFAIGYEGYMTHVGRNQARRVLLSQDPRTLEDMGISRHLLLQGVDAWPWREGEVAMVPTRVSKLAKSREEKRAIRELRAMSNAELSDMGISRGGIVDAVRNGRPEPKLEAPRRLRKEQASSPAKDYAENVEEDFSQDPHNAAA